MKRFRLIFAAIAVLLTHPAFADELTAFIRQNPGLYVVS